MPRLVTPSGKTYFPTGVALPKVPWEGEPAAGARWRRHLTVYRAGWLAGKRWTWELAVAPGNPQAVALTCRTAFVDEVRGFAVYRCEGRWSLAILTRRLSIRAGHNPPYQGVTTMMVMRP